MVLPSGLSESVADHEYLVRFLYSRNDYNTRGPKWTAFMPRRDIDETSVFRSQQDIALALWKIGEEYGLARSAKLHGAAQVVVSVVRRERLNVTAGEPPPSHANIVGWPIHARESKMQKAARMECAKGVAAHAAFKNQP